MKHQELMDVKQSKENCYCKCSHQIYLISLEHLEHLYGISVEEAVETS